MLADQSGHLEHRDLSLAENGAELFVCVDHALVDLVLQTLGLDVSPQLADDLGARQGLSWRLVWQLPFWPGLLF